MKSIRTALVSATSRIGPRGRRTAFGLIGVLALVVAGGGALAATPAPNRHLGADRRSARHVAPTHRRHHRIEQHAHRRTARHYRHAHKTSGVSGANTPACASSDMSLKFVSMMAGMFHYANVYALTNNGSGACTLEGYPALTVYHAAGGNPVGATVPVTVHNNDTPPWGGPPSQVTIPSGASAGIIVGYVADPDLPPCEAATTFQIRIPGAGAPMTPDQTSFNVCPGSAGGQDVYVSAVLPQPAPTPTP